MKHLFLILSFFFSYTFLSAQGNFEGVIKLKSSTADGINGTFYVKGDKVRSELKDPDGKEVIMISDKATGDIMVLSDRNGQKTASKMNLNQLPASLVKGRAAVKNDFTVTVTEETKKIKGYQCVRVLGKDATTEGEAWVAKDLNFSLADLLPKSNASGDDLGKWQSANGVKGFIMQLTTKELATGKEVKMDAEVNAKSLKDKDFELSPEYKVMDISKVMESMNKMPDQAGMEAIQAKVKELEEKMKAAQAQPLPVSPVEENVTPQDEKAMPVIPAKKDGGQ